MHSPQFQRGVQKRCDLLKVEHGSCGFLRRQLATAAFATGRYDHRATGWSLDDCAVFGSEIAVGADGQRASDLRPQPPGQ
ncbi:MAG: hypothetical protein ACKPJJ_28095, partial [Planctomycetaceae bacterium]